MRNPRLIQMFASWVRALTRIARRWVGLNAMDQQLRERVVVANATTVEELRRELRDLLPGMSLQLSMKDVSPDVRDQLWWASTRLGEEFGCSAEFRPDGDLWFVKEGQEGHPGLGRSDP